MNVLGIILQFAAAHYLPDYDGQCANLHGHTWKVEFQFQYDRVGPIGIAYDFKPLKEKLKAILPDHSCLNDILQRPTAENLVMYFRSKAADIVLSEYLPLALVRVWESETAFAEWRA